MIEIEIASVEKGERLKKGEIVYARAWSLKKVGDAGHRPGPSGHFHIPAEGEAVIAFLAYGKFPPTGQSDNGYTVVYPNGIEKETKRK